MSPPLARRPRRPRTVPCLPRLAARLGLLLASLVATAPAFAFSDLQVRLEPLQPLPGQDFVLVIEGHSETLPVVVEDVTRDGQSLHVLLQRPACPGELCSTQPFRVALAIDGSTVPFERGLVDLSVDGRAASSPDPEILIRSSFAVGQIYPHSMEPEIVLNPWQPTDNDRLQLLVPVRANACGPSPPQLDRVERQGSRIAVFLRFSPGFGGEFATSGPLDPKCTPAIPFLAVTPVDLGALEAGEYSLDLYLQSARDGTFPIRVRQRSFTVTDAPDTVALQDGRFLVELEWTDFDDNTGRGRPVPGPSADSTLFTFFGRENWEVLVKVLDGCAVNDRYWVFGAAATDVEYVLTVTDTVSGAVWSRTNPLGSAAEAITDTDAFDVCP